jgi:hypothetical protein
MLSAAELVCYYSPPRAMVSFLVCVFGARGRPRFRVAAYWLEICRD